jgi:hypothetical protein
MLAPMCASNAAGHYDEDFVDVGANAASTSSWMNFLVIGRRVTK